MRAAQTLRMGQVEVTDCPEPVISAAGQLIVAMEYASICGSDLHALLESNFSVEAGALPGYSGHEGVGIVIESTADIPVGARVLTVPEAHEGRCFAERMLIDAGHAIVLPDEDPQRLMMAQQYGTTLYAMKHFWPTEVPARRPDTAVVIGCGSAGLFFIQELFAHGFRQVIASDLSEERLAVASSLGARVVLVPRDDLEAVVAEVSADGADLVIEAVGTPEARNQAVRCVRKQGIVGIFGVPLVAEPGAWDVDAAFRRLARIQYCVSAQAEPGLLSFREAIRRIVAGEVVVDYCLGTVFDLEELPLALQVAAEQGRGAAKVHLRIGAPG